MKLAAAASTSTVPRERLLSIDTIAVSQTYFRPLEIIARTYFGARFRLMP
jgi:hypothetical protein